MQIGNTREKEYFLFCEIEENSNHIDIVYKLAIIIEKYYKHYRNNQFAYMSRM